MGRFVNPDNSAFQAALNSRIYVDKTGMIEYMNRVLETTDAYICNSRPRRFGKSYAANMLAAYYSKGADSEKMFSDLSIGKTQDFKKYLNKYDVIHIDVQWFLANCEDKNKVVQFITKSVLDELREIYPECLKSAVIEMLSGAEVKVNTATFKNDTVNIQNRDEVLTYMIHLGYLGYDQNRRSAFVPNEEIRQELTLAVREIVV